jgi:outer membrane PBP1 activator LpoA protein
METQRRRAPFTTAITVCAALAGTLLSACSSAPGSLPGRPGFPGESPGVAGEETGNGASYPDGQFPLPADDADYALFDAVREALQRGDWLAATLALPHPAAAPIFAEAPEANQSVELWIRYYQARIAWLRGDLPAHGALLETLAAVEPGSVLARELLLHQLKISQLAGTASDSVTLNLALARMGGHPDHPGADGEKALWSAANRSGLASALSAWGAQYSGHPAQKRAERLQNAAASDIGTTQVALLVPLSGPLQAAGDAVSRGFMAAYYTNPQDAITVDILDTGRYASVQEAYAAATLRGAKVVIGPLGKHPVAELAAQAALPVPLLTLNRADTEPLLAGEPGIALPSPQSHGTDQELPKTAPFANLNPRLLQLSLAPEDEAVQLAARAFADGGRRALLIYPQGSWGERMESALRQRWASLGGQIPAQAQFGSAGTHSESVRDALGLDASAQRSRRLQVLFGESLEAPGRRREDLDVIFLLTRNSSDARSLKPLVNYHYAGDLPVYALSSADTGSNDPTLNRDLGGMRMLVMPWRLQDRLPGLESAAAAGSYAGLHALGADAYHLARRWHLMASGGGSLYEGLTATLSSSARGILQRELKMAEFDRGRLRPR